MVIRLRVALGGLSACVMVMMLLVGCDFFNSDAKKAEIIKLEQQKAERVASEKKDAVLALRAYIEGKCKLIEEERGKFELAAKAVQADAERFEKSVSDVLSGAALANRPYEEKLGELLKDKTVNELAQKYLMTGFAAQREAYVSRLRQVRDDEAQYREAIAKCESAFDLKFSSSTNWTGSTKRQRETEIARLQREIEVLEKRQTSMRKALGGSVFQERERNAKLAENDTEIARKRKQIDTLRDPNATWAGESRAATARQAVHFQAYNVKKVELESIDRRLKPKETALDVAKATEAQTVSVLRTAITAQRDRIAKSLQASERKMGLAKSFQLEVGVDEGEELRKLRLRVDKELVLETER